MADCGIDLFASLLNTGLGSLQDFFHGERLQRLELPRDPVFIIGHWRTGTTLLHELLALDGRNRCPTTFECFAPAHFLLTEPALRGWTAFLLPGHRPADAMAMGWERPQEDEFALCNMGVPSPYATMAFPNEPPQFPEYFDLERVPAPDRRRWQRMLVKFLKTVLLKRPGRLVLKSPPHTFRLPLLLELFPNARFVHMVRDPYVLYPSTIRLWKSLYAWQGYQEPRCEGLEEQVFRTLLAMHARLEATRGLVEPRRFFELRYEDLVREPIVELRAIYRQFELGDFERIEPAVRAYFARQADYRTNRYELPDGLRREISRRWEPYFSRYGYPIEHV
ncbi:MAG: sulfotransferase [Thermoguttaceae bacterium]